MNREALVASIYSKKTFLCVGLDTDRTKLPHHLRDKPEGLLLFNKAIIEATKDLCVSYKINTAFYEVLGAAGWELMQETFRMIPKTHLSIADAKRGDIGNTSYQYARAFFETMQADAITVAPYMGEDSIRPFLEYQHKWTIVLGLTSNAGSTNFQQRLLADGTLLYEKVLQTTAGWGTPDNLMFVTGATKASALGRIRELVPDHFLLVPGVGAQGGSLEEVANHGLNRQAGLLVNASRAIIYASSGEDFAEKAAEAAKAYAVEMGTYLNWR